MKHFTTCALAGGLLLAACQTPKNATSVSSKPVTKIAFGSCSDQKRPQLLWDDIVAQRPNVWVWLGDNVYGDTENMDTLRAKYARQKANATYAQLRQSAQVIGVWDDHDFGMNDGGKEYPRKQESQQVMLDFLDVAPDSPLRRQEGAYSAHSFGPKGQRVKVILLDGRYFRDPLKKEGRNNVPAPTGDILGAAQWRWLEQELANSDAEINIIGCGIQFLSEEHPFEKWANFPVARQRLLDLLARTKPKGALLISGDRHIAELSRQDVPGLGYPLYDVTSSGLTHTWATPRPEANRHRVGEMIYKLNYGLITIDWSQRPAAVTVSIRGDQNALYLEQPLAITAGR